MFQTYPSDKGQLIMAGSAASGNGVSINDLKIDRQFRGLTDNIILDQYPFLKRPHWDRPDAVEAFQHLESLPEADRPRAVAMVDGPGVPLADGLTILCNLAAMSPSNRLSVFADFESGDARSRSKAISCAADKPHVPDPRLGRNVLVLKEIAKGQAIGDEPEYRDAITSIESLQARLHEEYKREAAILARRRSP